MSNNTFDTKANPNLVESLGVYIRSKRLKKNIGLREMSEKLNISPAYLSNLESGKHSMMNPLLLKHIAKILEVDHLTLFKIIGYTDQNKQEIKEEIIEELLAEISGTHASDVIKDILKMTPEQIKLISKYVKVIMQNNKKEQIKNEN